MGHPVVPYGVPEGQYHVVLALHRPERAGAEPPVQRLVGSVVLFVGCVGHVEGAYRPLPPWFSGRDRAPYPPQLPAPDTLCGGQVGCGTRPYPLRAAAFRP